MRVRLEHPNLPGQPIHVRAGAVAAYQESGWAPAPEPPPPPKPAEPEQKSSRRRRAATIEEDSHGADAAERDE